MKRLAAFAPVAILVALGLLFALFGLRHDPKFLPRALVGKPVPEVVLPTLADGLPDTLSDPGGRPYLVNVFASWCVACRLEHSLLLQLKGQGVTIQGLDWKDGAADGARYLADNGDPYIKAGNDKSGRTGIDLGVAGVPETFVIDRMGRVRYKIVGPVEARDWDNTIKPLLQHLRSET